MMFEETSIELSAERRLSPREEAADVCYCDIRVRDAVLMSWWAAVGQVRTFYLFYDVI
jgi:hypothetical protein